MKAVLCAVTKSCLALCCLVDYSPPVSPVDAISQASILEWVAISSSRGSSHPGTEPVSPVSHCIGRQIFYHLAPWPLAQSLCSAVILFLHLGYKVLTLNIFCRKESKKSLFSPLYFAHPGLVH